MEVSSSVKCGYSRLYIFTKDDRMKRALYGRHMGVSRSPNDCRER